MNLMIVDDQPNVISALLQRIPWQGLGISNVYTATSALAAKEILKGKSIDILITDIEMPQENGLSLIRWARATGKDIECILLTSHANFFYAQMAISLDVSNYVIQPATNEDIIQAIERAKLKLLEKRTTIEKLQASEFLSSVQNTVIRQFFEKLPPHPQNDPEVIKQLEGLGVSPDLLSSLTVIFSKLNRWSKLPPPFSDFFSSYQMATKRCFAYLNCPVLSFYNDESSVYTVLFANISDGFENNAKQLQQEILKKDGCLISVFYIFSTLNDIIPAFHSISSCVERLGENREGIIIQATSDNEQYQLSPSRNYEKYMAQLRKFVQSHLDQPLTRDLLAQELGVSPDHLSTVVHFCTGRSLKSYITHERMRHGRELLRATDLSIGEIGVICGYESAAYFSKVYRDTYNLSPRDERKEQGASKLDWSNDE